MNKEKLKLFISNAAKGYPPHREHYLKYSRILSKLDLGIPILDSEQSTIDWYDRFHKSGDLEYRIVYEDVDLFIDMLEYVEQAYAIDYRTLIVQAKESLAVKNKINSLFDYLTIKYEIAVLREDNLGEACILGTIQLVANEVLISQRKRLEVYLQTLGVMPEIEQISPLINLCLKGYKEKLRVECN